LWGDDAIEEELLGLRFRLRPTAFLQTNTEMAEQLYRLAREYAGLTGGENVFDLYCGTGTIGLSLASSAGAVSGVEISEEAVSCNPPTLASDVQVLRDEYGYDLARCRPFDMFPHTPHVESVSLLKQRPSTQ